MTNPPRRRAASVIQARADRAALLQLVARHGHVDGEHRGAFEELISDTQRAALGTQTRAPVVLKEGIGWAVQIDQAFDSVPAAVEAHYSRARYTYFLDRLVALSEAIDAQARRRQGTGESRSTAETRESTARKARTLPGRRPPPRRNDPSRRCPEVNRRRCPPPPPSMCASRTHA
jgi:hypothetical protein